MGPELALAATIGSGLFSAVGTIAQSQSAASAARYQQQVARNNQIIAEQNARYAADAGMAEAQAQDFKTRAALADITAAQSASGISTESETSRNVRRSAAQVGRLDAQTIMANAALQSRAYLAQASNYAADAQLAGARASGYRTSGYLGAFSSLLGTATSFSDKWERYKMVGAI